MTTTDWMDRLSEYLDGTLTSEELSACEAWLASSAEGQVLLQDLRRVVAKAKTLPDVAVPEAVWAGISAGIREQTLGRSSGNVVLEDHRAERLEPLSTAKRRWQFSPLQLAAAAAVLLAVGAGLGLALRSGPSSVVVARGPFGRPTITTGTTMKPVNLARHADASYDRAVEELQVVLEQNRSTMDTATVRVLESSLRRIDAALDEAEKALASDPHSAYLNDHLSRIKRKKLDLLRQGASLVQAS